MTDTLRSMRDKRATLARRIDQVIGRHAPLQVAALTADLTPSVTPTIDAMSSDDDLSLDEVLDGSGVYNEQGSLVAYRGADTFVSKRGDADV